MKRATRTMSTRFDRLLDLIERIVVVAERWTDARVPKPDEKPVEAEIYLSGQTQQPQTAEEYERFDGKFAERYRKAHPEA